MPILDWCLLWLPTDLLRAEPRRPMPTLNHRPEWIWWTADG